MSLQSLAIHLSILGTTLTLSGCRGPLNEQAKSLSRPLPNRDALRWISIEAQDATSEMNNISEIDKQEILLFGKVALIAPLISSGEKFFVVVKQPQNMIENDVEIISIKLSDNGPNRYQKLLTSLRFVLPHHVGNDLLRIAGFKKEHGFFDDFLLLRIESSDRHYIVKLELNGRENTPWLTFVGTEERG